jgi:hypothetical protein
VCSSDLAIGRLNNCTNPNGCNAAPSSFRSEAKRVDANRKYNLENPFFQPLQFGFAAVTDLSFRNTTFDFDMSNGDWGDYTENSFYISQNVSFGVTDDLSFILTGRYASSSLQLDWYDPTLLSYQNNQSKFDFWALGLQYRFLNSNDWIANVQVSYQNLPDSGNGGGLQFMGGYKSDDTLFYGFARGSVINSVGDNYGYAVTDRDFGHTFYLMLENNFNAILFYDVGVGLFAALDSDWSVDARATYSDQHWHNQASLGLTVSYQPLHNVAFSLYGFIPVWDSANEINDIWTFVVDHNNQIIQEDISRMTGFRDTIFGGRVVLNF